MKKTAIVTGGGRGIGLAISRRLGRDGYNVVILGTKSADKYKSAFAQLRKDNIHFRYVQGNVAVAKDRTRLLEEALDFYGGVHVLVNNAGVAPKVRLDLLEMTEDSYDYVMDINTKGTLFLSQIVAKQMIHQPIEGKKRGVIINISSISAVASSVNRGEYCISKASISMLTKLFADRLAEELILVNEVRPGIIYTEMTANVKDKYDVLIANGLVPLVRWGTPEDVAGVVSAICSDNFMYTTGSVFDVDGGQHIMRF